MGGGSGGGGGGPLDTMRSLEQFLPGDQPRGFMGPDSGPKGNMRTESTRFDWRFSISFIFFKGVHHLLVIPTLLKVLLSDDVLSFFEIHIP